MKKIVSILLTFTLILSFSCVGFAADEFMPYSDSQFFEYGDYSLHYRVIPAEGTFKGRILMLHGFLCSTYSWQNMADLLSAEGYDCVLVDLPNFGYSTRETAETNVIDREELVKQLMLTIAPCRGLDNRRSLDGRRRCNKPRHRAACFRSAALLPLSADRISKMGRENLHF